MFKKRGGKKTGAPLNCNQTWFAPDAWYIEACPCPAFSEDIFMRICKIQECQAKSHNS
jgi:hypothetical protein